MARSTLIREMGGIISVLNTPFSDKNEIDHAALTKNVEKAISAGVVGFLVPAMAAEVHSLSASEQYSMISTVVNACTGHSVKVIGGIYAENNVQRIEKATKALALGADGILANIPFESTDQYIEAVAQLDQLNPPFLMLQDWAFQDYGLPFSVIEECYQKFASFKAIKVEVVPAGVKYSQILQKLPELHVSGGWAVTQMIEALDRGVHAFLPTGMHRIYCSIFRLYQEGNRSAAKSLFESILPVLTFSNQHLDISIEFFKELLFQQGIYPTNHARELTHRFDSIHRKLAAEHIQKIRQIEATLIDP